MVIRDRFRAEVERALGASVVAAKTLRGGDFAESFRFELSDSRQVFAKTHANPTPGFFTTEAAGLEWLRVEGGPTVPAVLAVNDEPPLLVLEWIEQGAATAQSDERFGRELAELHRGKFEMFGRPDGMPTGSQKMSNEPAETWHDFYAQRRLLPLIGKARDCRALSARICAAVERLASSLDRVGAPAEPPACLHGDLWAGNRLVDQRGHSWLIDPAVFGGHREFDLALMALFGGFGSGSFEAYDEAFPLADGWRQRAQLYQLATLIVHAIKFGGSYPSAVQAAVDRYV